MVKFVHGGKMWAHAKKWWGNQSLVCFAPMQQSWMVNYLFELKPLAQIHNTDKREASLAFMHSHRWQCEHTTWDIWTGGRIVVFSKVSVSAKYFEVIIQMCRYHLFSTRRHLSSWNKQLLARLPYMAYKVLCFILVIFDNCIGNIVKWRLSCASAHAESRPHVCFEVDLVCVWVLPVPFCHSSFNLNSCHVWSCVLSLGLSFVILWQFASQPARVGGLHVPLLLAPTCQDDLKFCFATLTFRTSGYSLTDKDIVTHETQGQTAVLHLKMCFSTVFTLFCSLTLWTRPIF